MGKRTQKKEPAPRASLLRGLYRGAVALSALIVVVYGFLHFVVREEPSIAAPAETQSTALAPDSADSTLATARPELSPTAAPESQPTASPKPTPTPKPRLQRKEKTWTFLLAASDATSGNADTIMVGMYDTVNQKAGLISIPRDTIYDGVSPKGKNFRKINSAYAYYGAEGLRDAVSQMLGIPIDHYVTVSVRGFISLVNAVDGIDFNIPVNMDYDDPTQDLHIHYSAGMRHLNGQQAMEVARFRHNNSGKPQVAYSDIQRTQTQQEMIRLIAKKVLSKPHKVGDYIEIFSEYVKTDLSLGEMLWFVDPALDFDLADLTSATLPGDSTVTYKGWTYCHQLDRAACLDIINEMVNPYTTPVTLEMTNMPQK